MKRLFLITLILISTPAWCGFDWWVIVPAERADELMPILDQIVAGTPGTQHYTKAETSWMATVTTKIFCVDERAEPYLTQEEWASRLTERPPEFVTPIRVP